MSALEEIQAAAAAAVTAIGPSVVRIGRGGGRGCGVVIGEGRVATNAHNLRGEETTVTFAGGREVLGTVAATDIDGDVAVVHVDTGDAPALPWAQEPAEPGQVVFVVTRPAAGGDRVSFGLVSGTARAFRGPRGRRIKGTLEHTAPLPRGSSGSPVVGVDGKVVGLNTNRLGEGFYLALPTDEDLRRRLDALAEGESNTRPRLGVGLAPAHVARALRRSVGLAERDGLLVRVVEEGSAAEAAGVQEGDLLVAIGDRPLASVDDLYDALEAGSTDLQLAVVRGAEELVLTVSFA
ncbi:MAG: S1C family serine protease [Acidimicrobiales bacterium]